MIWLCVLAGVYFLHLLLQMDTMYAIILAIIAILMTFVHLRQIARIRRREEEFLQVTEYLDSVLYTFLREEKVIRSFENVVETLRPGRMKQTVSEAISHMQFTFDESEILSDALNRIYQEFPCKRIQSTHEFLLHAEQYGGEFEDSVQLLLLDKNRWQQRIQKCMKEREKMFGEIVLSLVASLLICGLVLAMPVGNVSLGNNAISQWMTLLVLGLDDLILWKALKEREKNWIAMDVKMEEAYYEKKRRAYLTYDEKKERRLSILLASVSGVVTLVCFIFMKPWFVCAGIILTLFFWNQHRIGHYLQGKSLKTHLRSVFPQWLLDLVLLLQSENVHMAIYKSMELAPLVLQEEISRLYAGIEVAPESARPYHEFLEDLALPEVNATMSMLFSLSMGNSGHADRQMKELITRNMELLDMTEQKRLHEMGSGMYLLFLAPVVTASLKLLVDMVVFLLSFLGNGTVF